MIFRLIADKCYNCNEDLYGHLKYPDRVQKYTYSIMDDQGHIIADVDLKDIVGISRINCVCKEFRPKDNLKYLELIYTQKSKNK